MRFGKVHKDNLLLLNGEFNGIKSQVIASITLVEQHGDDVYITYKCNYDHFKHSNTICVNKDANITHVSIPNRVWSNTSYNLYRLSLKLGYLSKDTPWNTKSTRRYEAVLGGKGVKEYKYLYNVTIIK